MVQRIPSHESGAMILFLTAPIGLMIEDGVKAIWKSIRTPNHDHNGQSSKEASQPLWQKSLGLCWVMGWLGVTSTWYFYPQMLRPENQALVPFSIASRIGLPMLAGTVLIGGAVVAYIFEVEV